MACSRVQIVRLRDAIAKSCEAHRVGLASVAAALAFASAAPCASAQIVNYYAGTDSAGGQVGVYTTAAGQGSVIYDVEFSGNEHCDGILYPDNDFGGNTDRTEYYPIIDGRATFSELRPDFFIAADIFFVGGGKVKGTLVFKQAVYTGPDFPPKNRDAASCTTGKLTFTATYVGSENPSRHASRVLARQSLR